MARLAAADAKRYENLVASGDVSRSAFDKAHTQQETADAQANAARQQYEAALNGARQGFGAVESAQAGLAAARAQLAQAEATVVIQGAALESAKANLGYCKITAPVDGVVISRKVMSALSADQLAAVLRHERAHRRSRDNFKRLLILLAPGILPLFRGFSGVEQAWARVAEWAADDFAVAGDSHRSLTLAAALVRVARLGAVPATPVMVTSLMPSGIDLSARVDRLLHFVPSTAKPGRAARLLSGVAGVLMGASVIALIARPVTLHAAHEFLETLIR